MSANDKYIYSFVIPHKNSVGLLSRCLASIPERDDVEIIVVDDNSDDEKKPKIGHKNEQIVYLDKNSSNGAGKARNVGLEKASGRWVLFADCDDFYEKDFLNELDNYKDSAYDVVFFDAHFFYEVESKKEQESPRRKYIKAFQENPLLAKNNALIRHCDENIWSRMYRRDFVNKISAKFEERQACNDGFFAHYTSSNAKNIKVIESKLYYYVKNGGSISHRIQTKSMFLDRYMAAFRIRRLIYDNADSRPALAICFNMKSFLGRLKHQGLFFFLKLFALHCRYDVSFFVIYYYKVKSMLCR